MNAFIPYCTYEYFSKLTFPTIVFHSTLRIGVYLFCRKNVIAQFKQEKKMISHHTSLRENDDLSLWRATAIKKPPFFNVRALISREIMRSNDAQCNTKEWT